MKENLPAHRYPAKRVSLGPRQAPRVGTGSGEAATEMAQGAPEPPAANPYMPRRPNLPATRHGSQDGTP
jgi:hypothetical protein